MLSGNSTDNLIRSTLQVETCSQEPSTSVRDALLAEAARVHSRSAMGPAIPPLASGLRETTESDKLAAPVRLRPFTGQSAAEHWMLMAAPFYALR